MKTRIAANMMLACAAFALAGRTEEIRLDRSVMSDAYWALWNDAEQARIDAGIEANRKADAVVAIPAADGTEVTVRQLDHGFRFGAHIFNFNQLGKTEWNNAYKASYGKGGLFNQATVAFYWQDYEPEPGNVRSLSSYEDSEAYWNSLSVEAAQLDRFWRRPAPSAVIDFLKYRDVRIHGHILIWGSAKPYWIYDWFCPENEKRNLDALGIPRHADYAQCERAGAGEHFGYLKPWCQAWNAVFGNLSEAEIAAEMPVFAKEMRRIFRKRVMDIGRDYGAVVDSWDVVNESCQDWTRYRKARTGLPVWKTYRFGIMPGDYPLHALLDAKEAMKPSADLCVNEFNVGEDFREQIGQLEAEGARIDVVGCQMHIFNTNDCMRLANGATDVNWVGSPAKIRAILDTMAKTGKRIHVSEVTISAPGATDRDRMIQAILVRNIYRAWFSHPGTMGVTWWNTVDGGGVYGEPLVSGLFTRDMQKKPAYRVLDELINREWRTETTAKVEGDAQRGLVRFRGFRGRYLLSWRDENGLLRKRTVVLEGDGIRETASEARADLSLLSLPKGFRLARRASLSCAAGVSEVTTDERGRFDIAKASGRAPKAGTVGAETARISFRIRAPRAMKVKFAVKNDWFGALAVNGEKVRDFAGPSAAWSEGVPVALKEGANEIVFSCRAGSSGAWWASLAVEDPKRELAFEK